MCSLAPRRRWLLLHGEGEAALVQAAEGLNGYTQRALVGFDRPLATRIKAMGYAGNAFNSAGSVNPIVAPIFRSAGRTRVRMYLPGRTQCQAQCG